MMGGATQGCWDVSNVTPSACLCMNPGTWTWFGQQENEEKTDIWTKQGLGGSGLSAGEAAALQKLSVFVI